MAKASPAKQAESKVVRELRERIQNLEQARVADSLPRRMERQEIEHSVARALQGIAAQSEYALSQLAELNLGVLYIMQNVQVRRERSSSGIVLGNESPVEVGTLAQFYARERDLFLKQMEAKVADAQRITQEAADAVAEPIPPKVTPGSPTDTPPPNVLAYPARPTEH